MVESLREAIPNRFKEIYKDLLGINFIRNHFRTNFKRKVLISYINKPFISGNSFKHTNYQEALAIAEVFKSLSYDVDLINYTTFRKYNPSDYEVIFGLGEAVEYALQMRDGARKKPFVIWHGTGSSPFFSNPLTIKRLRHTYERSGKLFIESTRFLEKIYPLSYIYSDLIILYGNEFTLNTYRDHTFSPIELITPTTHFGHTPQSNTKSNSDYIWFGSAGVIHKGLDLLLEYFTKNTHLNLHICGDVKREHRFYESYRDTITGSSNIKYHGFVDFSSPLFMELMTTGTFTILPSCSEGIATSVLTTMANGGMIPIVTKNSGIDLNDYGVEIEELSPNGIKKAIEVSQQLAPEEILRRSNRIVSYTLSNYTIEKFSKNMKYILSKYLEK